MSKISSADSEIVEIKLQGCTASILKQAMEFLEIFLPKTLAKRLMRIPSGKGRHWKAKQLF